MHTVPREGLQADHPTDAPAVPAPEIRPCASVTRKKGVSTGPALRSQGSCDTPGRTRERGPGTAPGASWGDGRRPPARPLRRPWGLPTSARWASPAAPAAPSPLTLGRSPSPALPGSVEVVGVMCEDTEDVCKISMGLIFWKFFFRQNEGAQKVKKKEIYIFCLK